MTQLNDTLTRMTQRPSTRVGRGGKRGKTAGRGMKGQKSRAGNRPRPQLRDIIKKVPKLRGFGKNRARTVYTNRPQPVSVSLSDIERVFEAGAAVTPAAIAARGLVSSRSGRVPQVKLIGNEIGKKITVEQCAVSAGARAAIEQAGGSVVVAEQ